MDRRFNEIQQSMLDAKDTVGQLSAVDVLTTSEKSINDIDATSKVSIWRLFIWIFAYALWNHEKIVSANAQNSRPQNLQNLREEILNYRDGLDLVWVNGRYQYDLTGVADAEARKVITHCAILESNDGELVIKIAGATGQLDLAIENRIKDYIRQIKVPGVAIRLVNKAADQLKINLTVYVDTLITDLADGRLLNVSDEVYPTIEAVHGYLSKLLFNGALVKDDLRNELRNADGVTFAVINSLQWKFDAFPYSEIGEFKVAEAGYFKIDDADLTINYLSDALVNS